MRKKIETITTVEYPEIYPRTPECEKYLQLRAAHEDEANQRAAWALVAALGGTSGLNNAADSEAFRKTQHAFHDCQMTAMAFFSAKKSLPSEIIDVSENTLIK